MATATSTTTPDSFLANCKLDLDPSRVSTYERQSTYWLIAAGVTFVAFTALAVGACFYTGMFLPAYTPFVLIGSLLAAGPVSSWVKSFLEYSKNSQLEAQKYTEIQRHHDVLVRKTREQIQSELVAHGIRTLRGTKEVRRIEDVTPLLAQANYLSDKIKNDVLLRHELTTEAKNFAASNFAEHRQKIFDLQHAALHMEDKILQTKIQAAFVNAVLRKGDFNGSLEEIGTLTDTIYMERLLGRELGNEEGIKNFLTFKHHNLAPITCTEVKRLTVAQLGAKLVAVM
jgi:hypothetical protein